MTAVVIIVVAALVVAAVIAFVVTRTSTGGRAGAGTADAAEPIRPRPAVAEFHVRGDEAQVYFETPLPPGEVDAVLRDLLVHEAVEVVREKRHTLPIDDATKVVAFGRQDGEFVQVGVVNLETPGTLPPPAPPPLLLHHAGPDPLSGSFTETVKGVPGVAARPEKGLGPVGRELRLPANVEAGLRAQGTDPSAASAGELVLGILALSGYGLSPGDKAQSHFALRAGSRTYIQVDDYAEGEYPELAEGVINEFLVAFSSSGADRGLLVTDKFGPFLVYDKERREPRVRFVTRERLQAFVDSLALG